MLTLLLASSCHDLSVVDAKPVPVSAHDLAQAYRSNPGAAHLAYTDRRVAVRVAAFRVVGSEVRWWSQYNEDAAPHVVFKFAEPPKLTAPAWIEGTCVGGSPVTVIDCRAAPPAGP